MGDRGLWEAKTKRDEKLRRRRRRRGGVWLASAAALLLSLAALIFLYNADIWRLKKVIVKGGDHIKLAVIKKKADIDVGTNLLKFNGGETRKKIKTIPWVREVKFSRRLPNTLIIELVERKPFARLGTAKGYYLVDKRGFAISKARKREFARLPLISVFDVNNLRVGKTVHERRIEAALKALAAFERDLPFKVASISVPRLARLTIFTGEKVEVVYGPPRQTKKKDFVIGKILRSGGAKIIYLNVTVPENPVVRRVKSAR